MKSIPVLAFGSMLLIAPTFAAAQEAPGVTKAVDVAPEDTKAATWELDTSIPDAPGFAVIGLEPTSVVDPSITRITAFDLASYTDDKGNLKPGFALTISPYFWLNPNVTLKHYREPDRMVERILARTQISVGFAEGGEGKADKVGLGFSTELLGKTDYRLRTELYDCVKSLHDRYFGHIKNELPLVEVERQMTLADPNWDKGLDATTRTLRIAEGALKIKNEADAKERDRINSEGGYGTGVAQCRTDAAGFFSNQMSWVIAGGGAWQSKGGGLGNETFDGGSLWTSFKVPLGRKGAAKAAEDTGGVPNNIAFFGRYDFDKKAEIPGGTQDFDKLTAAVVGALQWRAGAKAALEAGYERIEYSGVGPLKDTESEFYALTINYPVSEGLWLELKGGSSKSNPAAPGDKDNKVTVSFRYAPPAK